MEVRRRLLRLKYSSQLMVDAANVAKYHLRASVLGRPPQNKYRWIAELQLDDSPILDVGANYGQSALSILHYRPDAEVICIEPNPSIIWALELLRRRFPRVSYVCMAAGADPGLEPLHIPHLGRVDNTGGSTLDRAFVHGRATELGARYGSEMTFHERTVAVAPLSWLPIEAVGAIKIDVEGHELDVLRGLGRLLRSSPPVLLEILHGTGEPMEFLTSMGYKLFELTSDGGIGETVSSETALTARLEDVLALR